MYSYKCRQDEPDGEELTEHFMDTEIHSDNSGDSEIQDNFGQMDTEEFSQIQVWIQKSLMICLKFPLQI